MQQGEGRGSGTTTDRGDDGPTVHLPAGGGQPGRDQFAQKTNEPKKNTLSGFFGGRVVHGGMQEKTLHLDDNEGKKRLASVPRRRHVLEETRDFTLQALP